MAYAARFPGTTGYGAITADMPEYANYTAKEIARWLKDGAIVERVSVDVARDGILEYFADKRLHKKG